MDSPSKNIEDIFSDVDLTQHWVTGSIDLFNDQLLTLDPIGEPLQQEGSLLMFYLDHVFPHQFPFYQPSLADGGRCWLLPLLTSSKPSYYATLSVSALHWRSKPECHNIERQALAQQQEYHYTKALQELRLYIDALHAVGEQRDIARCSNVLACVMQLITYEVSCCQSTSERLRT